MSSVTKFKVEFTHLMPCDSEFLFRWHSMPRALNRLIPHWEKLQLVEQPTTLDTGSNVVIKLLKGPLSIPWKLQISSVKPGTEFEDIQLNGPFVYWKHLHKMQAINGNHSLLVENLDYKFPILDSFLTDLFMKDKLEKLFNYRFKVMENDISRHYKFRNQKSLKVLITGSSGLVGSALFDFLSSGGHQVKTLVRRDAQEDYEINWDPLDPTKIDKSKLEGFDAVIHLAGENIANKRWTKKQKNKIFKSRVEGTKYLSEALASLKNPPEVLISASAIGYYGDRADEILDEIDEPGVGFLSDTCLEWENATAQAEQAGIRVVNTRIGIVLDPKAGALAKILPIFKFGLGGNLGDGEQWMSWISLDDVLGAIHHCIMNKTIIGPVNLCSPNPIRNKDFTKILAGVISRPAIFPAPKAALNLALGEMADELLLSSLRVEPQVLKNTGYEFCFPELESTLKHLLGRR